jgi:serralysin
VPALYGPPPPSSGDTGRGANATIAGGRGDLFGHLFDGDSISSGIYGGGALSFTIFDSGGSDLLDLSTVSADQNVDLRQGTASDILGWVGNMVIGLDSVIEDLFGGAGNDTLSGNSADNLLKGGAGNDTINGRAGTDTAVLEVDVSSVSVTETADGIQISSALGVDLYSNIEFFEFTSGVLSASQLVTGETTDSGDETLVGSDANDSLNGADGADVLAGGAGDDTLLGGTGNDNLAGSSGDDLLDAGAGNELIGGGLHNDTVYGGAGNDTIGAGQGNDLASGGDDDDIVNGGAGNDTLNGDGGNDTMGGSFGADQLDGGDGNDDMGGGAGADSMDGGAGNDSFGGGEGDDTINGEGGDDFLAGGGRHDVLDGGAGDDRLNGGNGDDTMTGGSGADVFIFNGFNDGDEDVITDFETGVDSFRMSGVSNAPGTGLAGKLAALNISDVSGGAQIDYDGHTVLIQGVSASDLTLSDFTFV